MLANETSNSKSIAGSLSKIKEVSSYQKALYEDLIRRIEQIDERLAELNPEVEAKVEIPGGNGEKKENGGDHSPAFIDYVGFYRGAKGWRLHYFRKSTDQNKIIYHQILTEARKDFQIRAVEQLPRLISALAEETQKKTDEIKNSLDLAEDIAQSLL